MTTWTGLEGTGLAAISLTEKDKYCMILDVQSKNTKPIDTENRLVVAGGVEGGGNE